MDDSRYDLYPESPSHVRGPDGDSIGYNDHIHPDERDDATLSGISRDVSEAVMLG